MIRKTLDLGCGATPKNPFNMEDVYGIDISSFGNEKIFKADLAIEPILFDNVNRLAGIYGFHGHFKIEEQKWHENKMHLITVMRKVNPEHV